MKAMILAAGLGTRLRPLTDTRPKALVEVAGRTLLEITLSRLSSFGVRDVIINVHHFPEMILDYLKVHNNFGLHIEISREERLLDTGGGLKKASWFFLQDSAHAEEPFILHNVDVISAIDLRRMLEYHMEKQALATLAVQHRKSSRQLLFDADLRLCGRRVASNQEPELVRGYLTNTLREGTASQPAERSAHCHSERSEESAFPESQAERSQRPQAVAFSGIHIISPRLLRLMQEEGAFSIIDTYLPLSARGEKILAFPSDDAYWRDLGKPADLAQAGQDLKEKVHL
ncbi:MAG TPA: nucleotidyltransferase family protein [Candidatus Acidoferrum sp.]|nr:nucleotidyltransferase family protein [Candidatus Acidoferrum sp.]